MPRTATPTTVFRFAGTAYAKFAPRAQAVGEVLEKIRQDNAGKIDVRDVVAAARPESSALHPFFEWDDSKAAREYRLGQAKTLVRAVIIEIPDSDLEVPAYVAHQSKLPNAEACFMRAEPMAFKAKSQPPVSRDATLRSALKKLEEFRHEFAQLDELAPLFRSIDKEITTLREQLEDDGE